MSHKQHYSPAPPVETDAWHRHVVEEEGLPQEEHGGNTRPVALAPAFILCFGFVPGPIPASYLYFQVHMTTLRREKIENTVFAQDFAKSKAAELAKQQGYYFSSEDKARNGLVAPSIEEAKKRIIARYAAK